MRIGATYLGASKCEFVVWAPLARKVQLEIVRDETESCRMEIDEKGYWKATIENISEDTRYRYRLDQHKLRPDPASHFQPLGVHEASAVVDHTSFKWKDLSWKGMELSQMVMYELHVGTFTPEGTFEAILPRLGALKELGVNTIELMPVAQFPGERNWGYDGVYPFAVQNSYGGPSGLKTLIDQCHGMGIAVILDVVYNHLGPEGNYLADFGPYFTDRHRTLWGSAVNFDDEHSDEVRNFFIRNTLFWFEQYHVDALRLDSVHAVYDMSAKPFLQELPEQVESLSAGNGRKYYLIAESNLNDAKIIRPRELGGYGMDAQWNDDLHHCLHTLLTRERDGYYVDFGSVDQLVKSLREGFVYSGQYSPFWKRRHGNSSADRPAAQFVVFAQNHDQVGNRMHGERLSALVSFEALKLAAAVGILSPYIPLLFMGEEYAERAPFLFFVDHSDPQLIQEVRDGRKEEFRSFAWEADPPDPQSPETFLKSRIDWDKRYVGEHQIMLDFYKRLLQLKKSLPALSHLSKTNLDVTELDSARVILLRRWLENSHTAVFFNFNAEDMTIKPSLRIGTWKKILDSSDEKWNGPGTLLDEKIDGRIDLRLRGESAAMFLREE